MEQARSLTTSRDFPQERRSELLVELDRLLTDGGFRDEVRDRGISGVCAYSAGSGWLVFSGGSAGGIVSFAGGGEAIPFEAGSYSFGAFVGGQATWGIGLLIGLDHEAWFPGEYDGSTAGATAGVSSVAIARLMSEWHDHAVHIIATGAGLAANAGHVETTVTWKDAPIRDAGVPSAAVISRQ